MNRAFGHTGLFSLLVADVFFPVYAPSLLNQRPFWLLPYPLLSQSSSQLNRTS
ncbi:MAG: hypothetical protein GYA12_13045 [Chloroflexi bacterium]|jgi:hypothetical protein|nr:hypothetical protein [Chloroflexota bacterium]